MLFSIVESPTPASLQSSFGSAFNPQQQQQQQTPAPAVQNTQQMPPASGTTQYASNMYSQQQTPAQYATAGATQAGYQGATGTTQQGYQGYNQQTPAVPTSQYTQQNGMAPGELRYRKKDSIHVSLRGMGSQDRDNLTQYFSFVLP